MSVRRGLALGALGVVAALLVVLVQAPPRPTGEEAVTGPRLFKTSAAAVRRLVVTIGEHRVDAERVGGRWTVAGRPVGPPAASALADVVQTLVGLRAVDRFRPADGATFGLDPPRASVELVSPQRRARVLLGDLNAARSAVYARREGAPQVMLIGLYVISALERVVYFTSIDAAPGGSPPDVVPR
jgi:hypothetical protein